MRSPLTHRKWESSGGKLLCISGSQPKSPNAKEGKPLKPEPRGLKNYYFPPRLRANTLQEIR